MKAILKGNYATKQIWLNGKPLSPAKSLELANHSPDGFNWGYGGSGPAQLALAVCLELMGKAPALDLYQKVKFDTIAQLPKADFEKEIEIVI